MNKKSLYATISVVKGNHKEDINIFETEGQKYGIEIVIGDDVKKLENLTSEKQKIEQLLNDVVLGAQNFTLLEDFAYDFRDK